MSKAFTKDDRPDEPVLVRHRPILPEGVPNYVTARALQALRCALVKADPGAHRVDLERKIADAVVPPPPTDGAEVRFGARVTTRSEKGELRQVQLVGVDEADAAAGLIAFVAPLARVLLGRRAGDVVTLRTPKGTEDLQILSVEYDEV